MGRSHKAAAGAVVLVATAGAGGWVAADARGGTGQAPPAPPATGTAELVRTDVASRRALAGTLGYAGTYTVDAGGPGTLTRLPSIGTVLVRGAAAYEVDGAPVVLMYGARPVWRAFEPGMTDGADVRQLEANLKALGHGSGLTVDRHFSAATARAVRRWQRAVHLPVTGTIPPGQVVFVPGPLRVGSHDATVGGQLQPGAPVLHGTGDRRAVTAQVDPAQVPSLRVGAQVIVTMPDGSPRDGRVTAIGTTAVQPATGQDGPAGQQPPTAPVTIAVAGSVGEFLDQSTVQVAVTQESHQQVLAAPVTALHALPGARYEVVVVTAGGGRRHVPVELGVIDESTNVAEVSGPGLAEGQRVEVPRDGS